MHTCSDCELRKPDTDFYWHKSGGRKSSKCKPCYLNSRKKYNEEWRQDNVERTAIYQKENYNSLKRLEAHYVKEYNITLADYDAMYEEQKGKCAICGSTNPKTPKNGRFCVDHDHVTGKVRGLLCSSCNRGIGLLQDDYEIILNAYKYLTKKW